MTLKKSFQDNMLERCFESFEVKIYYFFNCPMWMCARARVCVCVCVCVTLLLFQFLSNRFWTVLKIFTFFQYPGK